MPRPPRHIVPGRVYHLISRFVDREWFISTPGERTYYLKLLARSLLDSDWKCFGYGVMSSHMHLDVLAGEDELGWWIRRVNSVFADVLNRTYKRMGSVFVRGPKAFLVPPEKFAAVLAYVHNNPVRAGIVPQARYSDWTSHRAYLGAAPVPAWLAVQEGLERAGVDAQDFDAMVRGSHVASRLTEWEQFDEFELEEAIVPPEPILIVQPEALIDTVAQVVGISGEALRSLRKVPDHVAARNAVIVCGDQLGLRGATLARALGMSQQAISKILTKPLRRDPSEIVELVMSRLRRAA